MKLREDPHCGIEGHYGWTLAHRRFLLFWKRWWLVCLQCEAKRLGLS
jgi:hypothetical protein